VSDDPAPDAQFVPAPGPLPPVIPGETPEGTGKKRRVRLFHADGTPGNEDDWQWGEFKKTGDIVLGGTDFAPTAPKVGHSGKPKKLVLEYKPLDADDLIPDTVPDEELRAVPWTLRGIEPPEVLFVEIFREMLTADQRPAPPGPIADPPVPDQPIAEPEPEAKPAPEPESDD
jgi:hypothetical protein